MKLSIIVPVFNEETTISKVLKKIYYLSLPKGFGKEIIVIDDGSSDKTNKKISQWGQKGIILLSHSLNLGKGTAIRTGLRKATGELILIQDADLEYDPIYYSKLLEPLKNKRIMVVYGTRLMNYPLKLWGRKKTVLPLHLIANRFLTLLTNLLYCGNITDMETGFKIFKREIFDNINIKSKRFDFEAEITAKILKNKINIIEVPITVKPRTYQEGKKIGWKDGVAAIWTLIKYRFVE